MLRTSFCAVPLFILVLPVTNSGPTTTSMGKSAAALTGEPGLHAMLPVVMPRLRHSSSAPITYGVVPLAAMPITTSFSETRSEERRVGKECRSRCAQYHDKAKEDFVVS